MFFFIFQAMRRLGTLSWSFALPKKRKLTFIINFNLILKSIGCQNVLRSHWNIFRKPNPRRRRAEPLQRCSQTLTLGRFRVLLEIQLRYFNLVPWFPICLEVADLLGGSDNIIELYFWPSSYIMVCNKLHSSDNHIFWETNWKSSEIWKYF